MWHYGRLLSTKPGLLAGWKEEYLSYEINQPEENNPLADRYAGLIDKVIAGEAVDTEKITDECIAATYLLAASKWGGHVLTWLED